MAHRAAFVLLIVAISTVDLSQARTLRQMFPGDGREAYINSRVMNMNPSRSSSTSRSAATPEWAETSASSQAAGTHRLFAPSSRRSYATVNAANNDLDNRNSAVQPRARSAQDIPGRIINRSNGTPNMPAMVMGGLSHAQTYEGATATASTDSLALNRGGRGNAFSGDMLTSRQSPMRRPGQVTWAVTSQGVRSGALVGATNGLVALAQADQAVAYSQGEQASKERKWVQGK